MKAQLLSLLVVASLIAMAVATPTIFLGGDFLGLAGTGVWDRNDVHAFSAYNTNTKQWSTAIQQPITANLINDIDDAGNGVFAVGTFTELTDTGFRTQGVAFFDGTKWCSIRESIAGTGHSVLCDTDSSCWVAGAFNSIHNLPSGAVDNAVTNFVRYTFNTANNEWVVDPASLVWNRPANTSNLLPGTTANSRLYLVTSGSNQIFFTYDTASNQIFRGAAAIAGWYPWANTGSVSTSGGAIVDWTVEGSSVYVLLDSSPEFTSTARAAAISSSSAATVTSCNPCPLTTITDWSDLVGSVNGSKYLKFDKIAVASGGSTQYISAQVDPDSGSSNDFSARWRVLSHSGPTGATLTEVGQPFITGGTNPIKRLFMDQNSNVVAVGVDEGNLFYPPNTDDDSGATVDVRTTDRFNQIAVFNGSSWSQAFGGGFEPTDPFDNFYEAYNTRTNEWFFIGPYRATYDVHADSLAYFDNDDTLTTPFFPLFTHKLSNTRSGNSGAVFDIVCKEADCAAVYVGGEFQFHGVDTYGSIAEVTVDQSGSPAAATVGGGLWFIDENQVVDDPTLQATAGKVFALARENNFLYAGGHFGRGSRPESPDFVCLNNIAKIDIDADAPVWVDLNGGCDNEIYDLIFWNGQLIAGGAFVQCGGGRVVNFVASYNYLAGESATWSSLNNGVDDNVFSLEVFQGRLIAGGDFAFAGGLPVQGVASWDGRKWRALLPACTDDCTSGLDFYFTNLVSPTNVYDLRTDLSGDALWGRVLVAGPTALLAKWQYVDGDLGRWTATGDAFDLDSSTESKGHRIANDGSDSIVLAAGVSPNQGKALYGDVGLYHGGIDNWVQTPHTVVASNVHVIRGPQAGSASTLSSPLSALLSLL